MTYYARRFIRVMIPFLATLVVGCSSVPVDRVNPERLTVNVEYQRLPDQFEVDVLMRTGFWQRRVVPADSILALQAADGSFIHLKPTSERAQFHASADISEGPFSLHLANFTPQELPIGPAIRLQDPDQIQDTTLSLNDRARFTFDNPTDTALRWEVSADCSRETFVYRRVLEKDDEEFTIVMRTAKEQLDRAAQARLLGTLPLTVTLYEAYNPAEHPPFRIRQARGQDSVDLLLTTPSLGVSVSGSVSLRVSPNAFVGIGAATPKTERCS